VTFLVRPEEKDFFNTLILRSNRPDNNNSDTLAVYVRVERQNKLKSKTKLKRYVESVKNFRRSNSSSKKFFQNITFRVY